MAQVRFTPYAAPLTAVESTDLVGLASGTAAANYRLGPTLDNAGAGYLYGDLELVLSAPVTAAAGAPNVVVYLVPSMDGTNFGTTGGSTIAGAAASSLYVGSMTAVASASVQTLQFRGIVLPPGKYKIMLQNLLGVALPGGTAKLYPYSEAA